MEDKDFSFFGNDPGAVKYGNFINYYSFHSPSERINNLNPKMFPTVEDSTLVCLDVGCNTGELTKSLKKYLKTLYPQSTIKILAVDIDNSLIERAKELNDDSDTDFVAVDIMSETGTDTIRQFLNNCCKEYFDSIFCFSVTMWIHINNGDEGLIKFLQFLTSIARSIIIEPQPWKCYRSAQRRMKRAGKHFPFYDTLKIRSDVDLVIEATLTGKSHNKLFESSLSSWNRKVQSYHLIKT